MKVVGNSCNHGFAIGEIVKIIDATEDRYDAYDLDGKTSWYVCDEDLELVEEENREVNEDITVEEFLKQQIEDLKIENKNLQAKIDYLRGQISVYERFLKEEN